MNQIEQYLELSNEIDICQFQLNRMSSPEDDEEINSISESKKQFESEIGPIADELNKEAVDQADKIRVAYIGVFNRYLDAFKQASIRGKVLDLHQSMINPGYLLGMPVHDLRNVLTALGEVVPHSHLQASTRKWDHQLLVDTITEFREEIMQHQFATFIEAIDFFQRFHKAIQQIADQLRTDRVI